jgi:hypothetical protein
VQLRRVLVFTLISWRRFRNDAVAVIGFSEHEHRAWVAAGWAFRYVLDEASKLCDYDVEVIEALELATAVGYLQLPFMDAGLACRIAALIRKVAEAEVNEAPNEFVDETWQESWRSSM